MPGTTLAGLKADFYCQDALTGWPVKPDVVVSDLPIGFYANDDNAKKMLQDTLFFLLL